MKKRMSVLLFTAVCAILFCTGCSNELSPPEVSSQSVSQTPSDSSILPDQGSFAFTLPSGVSFGISETKLRKIETRPLYYETTAALTYSNTDSTELGGLKASYLVYGFNNMQELWVATFDMGNASTGLELLTMDTYHKALAQLTQVLGMPDMEKDIWSEHAEKKGKEHYAEALSSGELTWGVEWIKEDVRILFVFGKEQRCLQYQSMSKRPTN